MQAGQSSLVVIPHTAKSMSRENASITCKGLNRWDCSMSITLRFILAMSFCQFSGRKPSEVSKAVNIIGGCN